MHRSIPPMLSAARSMAPRIDSASRTSPVMNPARDPAWTDSATISAARSAICGRSISTMDAPSAANRRAVAAPKPLAPPVITARLPRSRLISTALLSRSAQVAHAAQIAVDLHVRGDDVADAGAEVDRFAAEAGRHSPGLLQQQHGRGHIPRVRRVLLDETVQLACSHVGEGERRATDRPRTPAVQVHLLDSQGVLVNGRRIVVL